jgi:hypothetical protein
MFGVAVLVHFGTKVNSLFTFRAATRYACMMLLLAAAAVLAAPPQDPPVAPASVSAQATATVRIISGAVLRLGEGPRSGHGPSAQDTVAHVDGAVRPAKLIEFE